METDLEMEMEMELETWIGKIIIHCERDRGVSGVDSNHAHACTIIH